MVCSPMIPGFSATAACQSDITYIDGRQKAFCCTAVIPIEQLAAKVRLSRDLLPASRRVHCPTQKRRLSSLTTIKYHTMVNRSVEHFISGFRYDAHPMAMLCGCSGCNVFVSIMTRWTLITKSNRKISAHRLIAKIPTIAAMCHKHFTGQPFYLPR